MLERIKDTRLKLKLKSYLIMIDSNDITPKQAINRLVSKAKDQLSYSVAFILCEIYNINHDLRNNCRKMGMSIGTFM